MDVRWSPFRSFTPQLMAVLVVVFAALVPRTDTFKQQGGCFFPERWEGTWFQSGVRQPIVIEGPRLSSKGRCLGSEGDKFLVVDDKRVCYRCVVIHEKHANVLQYKETFCQGREALPTLCTLITGDALLYSMFRENGPSVPCPFRGSFTFGYNRGHGVCESPVSSIDVCTEDSRLLLSYQACPDVHSSESAVEELQCLATWKEGSSRYLVGRVHHNHATSNEDRFRCFVYEKASPASEALDGVDYRVAQSGDATCNGLFSATDGSRTMTLKKAPTLNKCRFPAWIANHNYWHTLNYSATYSFHHRNSTLRVTNSSGLEMKIVCTQVRHTSRDESSVMLLTHFTTGCQSGFACMAFHRRDADVMEVQTGAHTKRQEDACQPTYFNRTLLPYVTLVTNSPEPRKCPYMGKFSVSRMLRNERPVRSLRDFRQYKFIHSRQGERSSSALEMFHGGGVKTRIKRVERQDSSDCDNAGFSNLIIGCNSADTMEFRTDCATTDIISTYSCHGRWEENGTNYLITTPLSRSSHGARTYCFIYKEFPPDVVAFSTSIENCDRNVLPGITGELVFNVTSIGKCLEASNVGIAKNSTGILIALALLIIRQLSTR
ncbi:PREDICTED: uncharacterized protein LOC108557871 [Nicrophorus vespilloides]|uniref:Uncharacterized protein LOC108557871 n=1 Tax=Nicrophorus vespilloides TaxID=110193 RepID=A0ABM1M660_NICVS|nr:PREDICTED: uncharacterized protein LOC108557871 [Nicrophorus vespilloides]